MGSSNYYYYYYYYYYYTEHNLVSSVEAIKSYAGRRCCGLACTF